MTEMPSERIAPAAIYVAFLAAHSLVRLWPGKPRRRIQDAGDWLYRALNIAVIGLFYVVLPCAALFTPWIARFDFAAPRFFAWLSVPIFADAVWTFWLSHTGWGLPADPREAHAAAQQPRFASLWIWTVAQSLCVPNCLGGVGSLAAFALLFFLRSLKPLMAGPALPDNRIRVRAISPQSYAPLRQRTRIGAA